MEGNPLPANRDLQADVVPAFRMQRNGIGKEGFPRLGLIAGRAPEGEGMQRRRLRKARFLRPAGYTDAGGAHPPASQRHARPAVRAVGVGGENRVREKGRPAVFAPGEHLVKHSARPLPR